MAKPEVHRFAFTELDFKDTAETDIPGLYAVRVNGEILVARRGGAWYRPRGYEAESAQKAIAEQAQEKEPIVNNPFETMEWGDGQAKPLETTDLTPVGMSTPKGNQRVIAAQQEWDSATHALANALKEMLDTCAYGEGFTGDELHQLNALIGARDRKQEAFLRAVAGK